MCDSKANVIRLEDYKVPDFLISEIELDFDLGDETTRVKSRLSVSRNPASGNPRAPLVLNGERLKLLRLALDGRDLSPGDYEVSKTSLTLAGIPDAFTLECETQICPHENKALEGLYVSGGIFCTQNEPEGFRKITYFLDRPDVMARYSTTIRADRARFPVLLSNGNPMEAGTLPGGRHFARWQDPFPKPSYLFALVAGDLGEVADSFVTRSGRTIQLKIFVDRGNESRCGHAMRSLKNAMKWDEETFGLECDLDTYMIVAVDAFNFGAMENKGLNIFNSQYVLADPATATDQNYLAIENVVGHEYFHNWTGNRVTCRDWFQITLKEGLTFFRDHEFSSDMGSRAVNRISAVRVLRDHQFVEDAGPNAHPIRPPSYIEVNNFYTVTVYNKGAEVIGMIETLIGKENFRRGITKYFELYDGQAVTTDDFVHAMEVASGCDLTPFKIWYQQFGTPVVRVRSQYDDASRTYTLEIEQTAPRTARPQEAKPFYFPFSVGLLGRDGRDLPLRLQGDPAEASGSKVLVVSKSIQKFVFEDVREKPVASLLRNFSAPVKLEYACDDGELTFLMAHDSDPINRWEAGQVLAMRTLETMLESLKAGASPAPAAAYVGAFGKMLGDENADPALRAECMILPSVTAMTERMAVCDFESAFKVREILFRTLAAEHRALLETLYARYQEKPGSYAVDSASIGRRALKNMAFYYRVALEDEGAGALAAKQFREAANMTDSMAVLEALTHTALPLRDEALAAFYKTWKTNPLVLNKWFAVQASSRREDVLETVKRLEKDPVFDRKNPNKLRALYTVFSQNLVRFHQASGEGYRLIADRILEIDRYNPSAASKLSGAFRKFASLDTGRRERMQQELERILAVQELSRDTFEIISKTLESGTVKTGSRDAARS